MKFFRRQDTKVDFAPSWGGGGGGAGGKKGGRATLEGGVGGGEMILTPIQPQWLELNFKTQSTMTFISWREGERGGGERQNHSTTIHYLFCSSTLRYPQNKPARLKQAVPVEDNQDNLVLINLAGNCTK